MENRSHVPTFGNWESEENVPYTAYFDKARKGRGGKMINPNDPEENSDVLSVYSSSSDAPPSKPRAEQHKPMGNAAVRPMHDLRRSKEDDDFRQFANSPARHDNGGRSAGNESGQQRRVGLGSVETHRRPARTSAGSERSVERSPFHRHAKVSGRDSPSWEGKSSYEGSHGTPGRSRLRPRGDETPDQGAAVPKFGEWEDNPASAEGFTHIFDKVREERQIEAGKVPGTPERSYPTVRKPASNGSAKEEITSMSTRGVRVSGAVRGYRRRKNIVDLDLNRTPPPSDNQEGTSSQLGDQDAQTSQQGQERRSQQVQAMPPAMIDVEAIDDDVVESSPRAFAQAKNNSRRNRGRTVVDVDLDQNGATHNNKRRRIPPNQPIINCDICINLEGASNSKIENIKAPPPPPPKEPVFTCPVCMGSLVEEMSTKCGHIFCKTCIKAAINVQSKCPTCRKKVTVKELIRVFLPSAS